MKIKFSIIAFILVAFFNMGAICSFNNSNYDFYQLENLLLKESVFQENGIKLQYKTKEKIDYETSRIKQILRNNITTYFKVISENEVDISNENFNINIKLWTENSYTYVEITLINSNIHYTTSDLINILKKIENYNLESTQYFLYYKGKISQNMGNQRIYQLFNGNNIKESQWLEINSGYSGVGYLNNGERINFALTTYDTGEYVIIGTPIIIGTY